MEGKIEVWRAGKKTAPDVTQSEVSAVNEPRCLRDKAERSLCAPMSEQDPVPSDSLKDSHNSGPISLEEIDSCSF